MSSFQATPILLTDEPVTLAIPSLPLFGSSRLVATLTSSHDKHVIAVWEFELGSPEVDARLILSPDSLDDGFLMLDGDSAPPIAAVYRRAAHLPARSGTFDLAIERSGPTGVTTARAYHLRWRNNEVAEQRLASWRASEVPPVKWFYVELTTHCNLKCPFCPSKDLKRPRSFMSLDLASEVFGKIGRYYANYDSTSGYLDLNRMVFLHVMGEPLLHPHFVECVQIAKDAGLEPALFTNATFLNKKNRDKLFAAGLKHVTLSINATSQAGYDSLGGQGTFEEQESRVAKLLRERSERRAHGLHVDIQYLSQLDEHVAGHGLLTSRNQVWSLYRRWRLLLRHLDAENPTPMTSLPVSSALRDPLSPLGSDPTRRFALAPGVDLAVKTGCSFGNSALPSGYAVAPTEHGRCPFDNQSQIMTVYVDGSVSFCSLDHENQVNLGNLAQQSIDDIWKGHRLTAIRRAMAENRLTEPLCQKCLGSVVPTTDLARHRDVSAAPLQSGARRLTLIRDDVSEDSP